MATDKNKKNGYLRVGSITLLTIAAVNGITHYLGGGLRSTIVAGCLAGLLFASAIDSEIK